MVHDLERVAEATRARAEAIAVFERTDAEWREAIIAAVAAGSSTLTVGRAAGISKQRVSQIVRNRR